MTPSEQLKAIREQKSLTQKELAQLCNVGQGIIGNIESGSRDIPKSLMKTLVQKFGINSDWLLTGEGEMFREDGLPATSTKIPLLRQSVSCGPGQEWQDADCVEEWLEPLGLLPCLRSTNIYAFRVRGASMVGAGIHDGDIVFFDAAKCGEASDDIYVFALDGSVYCKLLKFDPISKKIQIYSVHSSELDKAELLRTLDVDAPDVMDAFHLFGRVRAWMHENRLMSR